MHSVRTQYRCTFLLEEAFHLYREKLTPDGILLVHLTNNYLELTPVIAGSSSESGLVTLVLDNTVTPAEATRGGMASRWALIVSSASAPVFEANGWNALLFDPYCLD